MIPGGQNSGSSRTRENTRESKKRRSAKVASAGTSLFALRNGLVRHPWCKRAPSTRYKTEGNAFHSPERGGGSMDKLAASLQP